MQGRERCTVCRQDLWHKVSPELRETFPEDTGPDQLLLSGLLPSIQTSPPI